MRSEPKKRRLAPAAMAIALVTAAASASGGCSLIDTAGLESAGDASTSRDDGAPFDSAMPASGDATTMTESDGDTTLPGSDAALDDTGDATSDATGEASAPVDAGPPTYVTAVLADEPLAYFRLGDQGVVATSEVHATTYAGVYSGEYTQNVAGAIDGDSNGAVHFPGQNGSVAMGNVFELANNAAFTFEIWVRLTAAPDTTYRRIFGRESPGAYPNVYTMLSEGSGPGPGFGFVVGGTTAAGLTPTTALPLGEWTYLVVTYDGTTMRLYENTTLVALTTDTSPTGAPLDAGNANVQFRLGADPNNFSQWNGDLDELAVYDHALDAAAIKAHYALAGAHDAGPFDAATVH